LNKEKLSEQEIKTINAAINEADAHINRINKIEDTAKKIAEL